MSIYALQHRTMTIPQLAGLASRMMTTLGKFICGLRGHDALLHFEQGRMSLQCASCGHESPGWDVQAEAHRRPVITASPRLVQIPLVHRRAA